MRTSVWRYALGQRCKAYIWGDDGPRCWTYGAADAGTRVGFHLMNAWWHPTMYSRVRV